MVRLLLLLNDRRKNAFDSLACTFRGILPAVDVSRLDKIVHRQRLGRRIERINDNQLDLHLFGNQAFDVDAGLLSCADAGLWLSKSGKVGSKMCIRDSMRCTAQIRTRRCCNTAIA